MKNDHLKATFMRFLCQEERYRVITDENGITITEDGKGVIYVGTLAQKKVLESLINSKELEEEKAKYQMREAKRKFMRELTFIPGLEIELKNKRMPEGVRMFVVSLIGNNYERTEVKLISTTREEKAYFFTNDLQPKCNDQKHLMN